jgi:hypothetical protein
MRKGLSLGRIWVLTGVLFLVAMFATFSTIGDADTERAGLPFMMVASFALLFASGFSLYRLFRWAFTRQGDAPGGGGETDLVARLQDVERTLTVKQLQERIAELERKSGEQGRGTKEGGPTR